MCVPVVIEPQIALDPQTLKDVTTAAQQAKLDSMDTWHDPGSSTPATAATPVTDPATGELLSPKDGAMVSEKGNPGPNEQAKDPLATGVDKDLTDAATQTQTMQDQIAAQQQGFQSVAAGILQSQQMAAEAMKSGFLSLTDQQTKALAAADELRKNTGQAQRKPNYSLSLKANAAANRGGITSTMLTGAGGVGLSALTLGRPALLGG